MRKNKTAEACSKGDLESLQALLSNESPKCQRSPDVINFLLGRAAQNNHAHIVHYLLNLDLDVPISPNVVYAAASTSSIEVYNLLLQHQPDILTYGWEYMGDSVMLAVLNNDLPFLSYLLENGADPGRDPGNYDWRHHTGSLPLELAVLRSQKDVIRLLLHHGAMLHPMQALHWAAGLGKLDVVELLVESGANVDALLDAEMGDYYGERSFGTALHGAVRGGQVEVVRFLLGRGADVRVLDSEGRSAVGRGCEAGDEGIIGLVDQDGSGA